jgi:hypothetical protein
MIMKRKNIFWLALVLSGGLFDYFQIALAADETNTNHWSRSFTINYTNAQGVVTEKTITQEDTNENGYPSFIVTNIVSFISSVTNTGETNLAPSEKTLVAVVLTNAPIFQELLTEENGAAGFMDDLRKEDRLPGISKDEHGDETWDIPSTSDSWHSKKIKYPFLLTYQIVLHGDSLTNHYTVMQPSKNSAWLLQRAWRTDSQGRVIKEWPVEQP